MATEGGDMSNKAWEQGPFWQENTAYFQAHDPEFLAELADLSPSGSLDIQALPNGLPISSWQNQWIDPPESPQQQALQIVGSGQQQVHIHFGLGLGYYLEVDQVDAEATVVVFEPLPELALAALAQRPIAKICQRKETFITCGFARLEKLLMVHMTFGKGVKVVVSPAHERLFPEQLQYFQEVFNKVHEIRRLAKGMLGEAVAGTWAATFRALPYCVRLPGAEVLQNQHASKPALVVSAGPSLKAQLPMLRALQQHFVIIAISRAAKILDRYDIRPDYLVHVESQDYFHLIRECQNLSQTTFLLADQSQRQYFQYPHGHTAVYQSSFNPVTQWSIAQKPELKKLTALNSGSVSSIAFHLALEMGCNPIVAIGQDLAFKDDELYADGGDASAVYTDRRLRQVPGVFGDKLKTSNSYLVTLYWFEKMIPHFRKRFPGLRLFNATQSGAALPFFEHRSLAHIAHTFAPDPLPQKQASFAEPPSALSARALDDLLIQLEADLAFIAKHAKQYDTFERAFLKKLSKAKKPKDFQTLQKQMPKLDAINNSLFTYFDAQPGLPAFFQAPIEAFRKFQLAIQQRAQGPQRPDSWGDYMRANLKDLAAFHDQVQRQAQYIKDMTKACREILASELPS